MPQKLGRPLAPWLAPTLAALLAALMASAAVSAFKRQLRRTGRLADVEARAADWRRGGGSPHCGGSPCGGGAGSSNGGLLLQDRLPSGHEAPDHMGAGPRQAGAPCPAGDEIEAAYCGGSRPGSAGPSGC